MATELKSTKVITNKVRFSYANVWDPQAGPDGGDPKYSVVLLIPKTDTKGVQEIKDAIQAALEAGLATKLGGKRAGLKMPLRDGDLEKGDDENYQGMYFIRANSKTAPGVVDAQVKPILDRNQFYSGCYGRASVNFYAFNANGNRGIACGLNHVQKTEEGEPLSTRSTAEADFGDLDPFA